MRYPGSVIAPILASVILFFITPSTHSADELKFVTIQIPVGVHEIDVTNTDKCVKTRGKLGSPGDTVNWLPLHGSGVTKFDIDFVGDSPFVDQKKHFDQDNNLSKAMKPVDDDEADVYKYKIKVKGFHTCDPHVIVVKGRYDEEKR